MVNCSHCGKKLERSVFCNASCKTMFHRKRSEPTQVYKEGFGAKGPQPKTAQGKAGEKGAAQAIKQYGKTLKWLGEKKDDHPGFCKHGSAVGLCKHGCTK